MKKHFVIFCSPGTFVNETTAKEIESWDVEKAIEMARTIHERHGATPYAFYFMTKTREEKDLDSKVSSTSPFYFLGGEIETVEQVRERNDKNEEILLSNMINNGYDRVLVNKNSWKITVPLGKDDIILDFKV